MRLVIHLNGPVNSGKSSVGTVLATLAGGAFVEGDDHGAPDDAPLGFRIGAALDRIATLITGSTAEVLVVAYPLDDAAFRRLRTAATARGAAFRVVTLAPPLAVALADRGGRRLSAWERGRIAAMYAEGYASRPFSDLVLNTAGTTPRNAARLIWAKLG
jgi:chloramphenicol 3-O-phosphotransferase